MSDLSNARTHVRRLLEQGVQKQVILDLLAAKRLSAADALTVVWAELRVSLPEARDLVANHLAWAEEVLLSHDELLREVNLRDDTLNAIRLELNSKLEEES